MKDTVSTHFQTPPKYDAWQSFVWICGRAKHGHELFISFQLKFKLRRERRIKFVRKHMLIRSENQTPSRSRFPLLRVHKLLMTFTVISNLNTSTLTSLLGKQLINENTQGAQKMAKFIISFCKGIFELFHILVFPSMENC